MTVGFRPQATGSVPDATKDSLSACRVRGCKIRGSESLVVSLYKFSMDIVAVENFSSPSEMEIFRINWDKHIFFLSELICVYQ